MREAAAPVRYRVGTPRGHWTRYEAELSEKPWENVRAAGRVKLLNQEQEVYVLAESRDRRFKEREIRLRKWRAFVERLEELRSPKTMDRDNLLKKRGAAEKAAGRFARLLEVGLMFPH